MRALANRKALGLLALAVLVAAICVRLGFWQLGVATDEGAKEAVAAAAAKPEQPLREVVGPHEPFRGELSNRKVVVTGRYAPDRTLLVVDHTLDGRSGSWVVSMLEVESTAQPGEPTYLPVLRGFVEGQPARAPGAPSGIMTVQGTLGPGESPRRDGRTVESGVVSSVDLASIVNAWPGTYYNALLFAATESTEGDPSGDPTPAGALTRVPPPSVDSELNLRNAAYAVQWWVFAVFFLWLWWKMVRADALQERPQQHLTTEEAHA